MRFRFAFLLAPALAAVAVAACSGESEGQPCDRNAGNTGDDDCANGLVCTQVSATQGSRCCPADRSTSTSPDCAETTSTEGDASPEPPDTSVLDTSTPDAPVEAGHEGGVDASEGGAAEAGAAEGGSAEGAAGEGSTGDAPAG
jgi:hypothetical protein